MTAPLSGKRLGQTFNYIVEIMLSARLLPVLPVLLDFTST